MVTTGLQSILTDRALLGSRCWGLATQAAAVTADLTGSADALLAAGAKLAALYAPEHGLRGAARDGQTIADGTDPATGLPVFSLYGETKEPTPAMLSSVDGLLFDMQDVGVRFYTYLSTLYYVLRGAAAAGKTVVVLDRPNPVNGVRLEGPVIAPGFRSFVGILAELPVRHALTFGELARWMAARERIDVDLRVVPMAGWRREMWFDETGLPWVPPSPAMPHLATATVYPGMCFLEGTNLSEGRGTSLPFEIAGAPWLDGRALAARLNRIELPGVRFRPVEFQPTASKHAGETCSGVQVHVTDRAAFQPVRAALHLIAEARRLAPDDFAFREPYDPGGRCHFDLLLGSDGVRKAIEAGAAVEEIAASWVETNAVFWKEAQPYLLYPVDS